MADVGRSLALGVLLAAVSPACLAIEEVQTPNGDLERRADSEPESTEPEAGDGEPGICGERGWSRVRLAGADQVEAWLQPSLTASCSSAPHRLTALAPELGAVLDLAVSPSTGRVVEATYATTELGADGERWGDYAAFIELSVLSFGAASSPSEQPFQLAGTIYGPYGPVSIEAAGCARVQRALC